MISYSALPVINACLNGTSAVLLAIGHHFIKKNRVDLHRLCMVTAFIVSAIFLISYLTYHAHAGVIRFQGHGLIRVIYFTILITHTILAVLIVPLVLRTLYLAIRGRFQDHRRWARWTYPVWLYVSVTGVIIYEMLY